MTEREELAKLNITKQIANIISEYLLYTPCGAERDNSENCVGIQQYRTTYRHILPEDLYAKDPEDEDGTYMVPKIIQVLQPYLDQQIREERERIASRIWELSHNLLAVSDLRLYAEQLRGHEES